MTAVKRWAQTAGEIARATEEGRLIEECRAKEVAPEVAEATAVPEGDGWRVPAYRTGSLSAQPITADNLRRALAPLQVAIAGLFDRWLATMEVSGAQADDGMTRVMWDLCTAVTRARATEIERVAEVTSAIAGLALNHADVLAPVIAARKSKSIGTMLHSESDFDRIVLALAHGLACVQDQFGCGFVEDPREFYQDEAEGLAS